MTVVEFEIKARIFQRKKKRKFSQIYAYISIIKLTSKTFERIITLKYRVLTL